MVSKTIQIAVVASFALVLLIIGIVTFMKKDDFRNVYDPLNVDENQVLDPNTVKYFQDIGFQPSMRVNDERAVRACDDCNNLSRPSACSQCGAFIRGSELLAKVGV